MSGSQQAQALPVKVYRTAQRVVVAMPMAGVEPEDIAVEVAVTDTGASRLVVHSRGRGELKGIKQQLADEWQPGEYTRELLLPAPVDGELANVTYGNGILVVALPIVAQARPAHITLEALATTRGLHAGHMGNPVRPYARA